MAIRSIELPAELRGGSADAVSVKISHVVLADGSRITLPTAGVTAIVGGNNAGKSTALRELATTLGLAKYQQRPFRRLINTVHVERTGTRADIAAWFAQHVHFRFEPVNNQPPGFVGVNQGSSHSPADVADEWTDLSPAEDRLGFFNHYFASYMDADRRGMTGGAGRRASFDEPPVHPLHHLEDDHSLLTQLQELSQRLFRTSLTLDYLSGEVRLRVGIPDVPAPTIDAVTSAYRDALARLPVLGEQGDGMRNLFGMILPILTGTHPIFIVDEPEAFLHPPQATALGRELGTIAKAKGLQIILATHDRNLLTGLLQADADVSVVRLSRQGDVTSAYQLDAAELRNVWNDPVLRYSNVLDGLFHRLVVLAEGDQDCRFYAAALDYASARSELPVSPTDVLFVPSSGKAGLARLARALHAVRVPVVASPDLDVLNDKTVLRNLVEACQGNWSALEADYDLATKPFRQEKNRRSVADVVEAITAILKDKMAEQYTEDHKKLVRQQMYVPSPFADLKLYGEPALMGVPESAAAAQRLLAGLREAGIVPVHVGDLEHFAPLLQVSKGPAWLPAALAAGAHKDSGAQEHIARVLAAQASRL